MSFRYRMVDAGRAASLFALPAVLVLLAACSGDVAAPAEPRDIVVVSGDRQEAPYGDPLPDVLTVRVRDRRGHPVPGAIVTWTADEGGSVSPATSTTDAAGRATTTWTLGVPTGAQFAHASVDGKIIASFSANAVDGGDDPRFMPKPLAIETYDGSGQTVHPDVVTVPSTWAHSRFLMLTPYPAGDPVFENPSIYTGDSPVLWMPPAGAANPIARVYAGAYLSDPDAVYVPETNELWVYYREVGGSNDIYLIRSHDGVHFTQPPRLVLEGPNHSIVSPTVVRRGPNDWLMWAVDANVGCGAATTSVTLRRSANGIDWSEPETVALDQPGYSPWHIDVQWIPSRREFWAVYNGKTEGTCATPALFMATSPDGVTWTTFPSPILRRGASPELADIVYRSTFSYDDDSDTIDFWYSGARYSSGGFVWGSAYQHRTRRDVFARAKRKPVHASTNLRPRAGVPALLNAP